mgnify:CR=1 FL=1
MPAGIRDGIVSSFLRLAPRFRSLKFLFSTGLVQSALFALDQQTAKEPNSNGLIADDF